MSIQDSDLDDPRRSLLGDLESAGEVDARELELDRSPARARSPPAGARRDSPCDAVDPERQALVDATQYPTHPHQALAAPVGEVEAFRDVQRAATRSASGGMSRVQSAPAVQDLLYPSLSMAQLATPGGFRRQYVAEQREETFANYVEFLTQLAEAPELELPPSKRASTRRTVVTFLKSFVGTAILFAPRGFARAGLLAGALTLAGCGLLSTVAMLLMFDVKRGARYAQITTYGHVMRHAFGPRGEALVDAAILMSQLGFCAVYVLFVGHNAHSLIESLWGERVGVGLLMCVAAALFLPLSLVRRLGYLAVPNLVADVIILGSVLYIFGYDVWRLQTDGPADDWTCSGDVDETACAFVAPAESYMTFLGTSVYTFEGVAMLVPLEVSMQHRERFPEVTVKCMGGIVTLLVLFGAVNYYVFGAATESIITQNLPAGAASNVITASYIVAAIISYPMLLFPASKLVEGRLGLRDSNSGQKHLKNAVRTLLVLFTLGVAAAAADQLDNLVSVIGGVCCVPIALIFPPLAHLKTTKDISLAAKALDWGLIAFGAFAGVVATTTALMSWA